jgi:hypothetical protein
VKRALNPLVDDATTKSQARPKVLAAGVQHAENPLLQLSRPQRRLRYPFRRGLTDDPKFRAAVARSHRRTAAALGDRIAKIAATPPQADSFAAGPVVMAMLDSSWLMAQHAEITSMSRDTRAGRPHGAHVSDAGPRASSSLAGLPAQRR